MLNSSRKILSCEHLQDDQQGLSNSIAADKGDDLIRVLRELTTVQRNIANLQVELQGRKVKKQMLPYTFSFELLSAIHLFNYHHIFPSRFVIVILLSYFNC